MPPIFPNQNTQNYIEISRWPEVNRKLIRPNLDHPSQSRDGPWPLLRRLLFNFLFLFLMIPLWMLHLGQLSFFLNKLFRWKFNHLFFGGGERISIWWWSEYLQWRVIEDNCPNCQFDSTTKPVIMLMEKEEYAATWIKLCKIQNFWEISRDQRSFHPYFR